MSKKTVTLDRNKIEKIGKHLPSVTIEQREIKSNKTIRSYDIYKMIRRKNKVFGYGEFGEKIWLIFKDIESAKKMIIQFKNALKGKK